MVLQIWMACYYFKQPFAALDPSQCINIGNPELLNLIFLKFCSVFVVLLMIFMDFLLLPAIWGCDELPWYLRDASNSEIVCWIGPFCMDLNGVANLDGLLLFQATICCLRPFSMYKYRQSWASESYFFKVLFGFCCFRPFWPFFSCEHSKLNIECFCACFLLVHHVHYEASCAYSKFSWNWYLLMIPSRTLYTCVNWMVILINYFYEGKKWYEILLLHYNWVLYDHWWFISCSVLLHTL